MAQEPFCNCCGCSQFDVLRFGFYESLNQDGPLVDFPTSTPTTNTVVSATWTMQVAGEVLWIGGGTSKFDLSASSISLRFQHFPLLPLGGGFGVVYAAASPPEGDELSSSATVSLYDSVEASATMELVERTAIPANGVSVKATPNYDPEQYCPGINGYCGGAIYSRWAFNNLPEPAAVDGGISYPAIPGTPLSDFTSTTIAGLADARSYREDVRLEWYCTSDNAAQPAGFDLKKTVSLGATSIMVHDVAASATLSLGCVATRNGEDPPAEGLFTAWISRNTTAIGLPSSPTNRTVTIYRNGEQVFSGNNPTAAQLIAAESQDGVYLTVTEVDDRSLSPWAQPHPDTRRHGPRLLKQYSSSVVDSVRPVVGFTPADDVYADPWETKAFPVGRFVATEPLVTLGNWPNMLDEDPSSVLTRPLGPYVFRTQAGTGEYTEPGTHSLRLRLPLAGFIQPVAITDHWDICGNKPLVSPQFQWTAHAIPEDNHLGATPKLEDPGLQTSEYWRPRLDTEPVSSLLLTFDRKVKSDGVAASQLTLTKDGASVSGCTMQQVSDTQWRITIPTGDQTPRSFWMLTYNPGGVVVTDDIATLRFEKRSHFPSVGRTKTVYIHKDEFGNDVRFSYGRALGVKTGPRSYVQLGSDEPPIDDYGYPYNPEPCRLATRVGWLMADMNGYPRQIDTGYTQGPFQIGRVASVSENKNFDASKDKSKLATSEGLYFSGQSGYAMFRPLLNYEGYTPSVPSITSPPDDCSYFGLSTTIDPCPPANVSACASPKVAQKHASAIRCDEDIASLKITLVMLNADGTEFDTGTLKYNVFSGGGLNVPPDFSVDTANINTSAFGLEARFLASAIMAKSGQAYTFGKTLDNQGLSQNVWACVDGSSGEEVEIAERRTRQPDGICTGWAEPLYSVGIRFPQTNYSPSDVAEFDVQPGYAHSPIRRNGEVVQNPEKYEPGDRHFAPGSYIDGRCLPWWLDRMLPIEREDFVYTRGSQSGIVRSMSGAVSQTAVQGVITAYRDHRTYPALKTTTLGELCISFAMRFTLKASVDYLDRKLSAKYYTRGSGSIEFADKCGNFTFQQLKEKAGVAALTWNGIPPSLDGAGWPVMPECSPSDGSFAAALMWTEWSSYDEGEDEDSKTVTHDFVAHLGDTLVFSKEQEEALANGDPVLFRTAYNGVNTAIGDYSYWKIEKG